MRKYLAILFALTFLACSFIQPAFAKGQDIIKMNSDIEIAKDRIANDVVVVGGNITIYGRVEGNVVAVGGSVILKPRSHVGQQIVVVGGDIVKDPTAEVAGKITQIFMPNFLPSLINFLKGGWVSLWATLSALVLFGFLGLAILLSALIPEHIGTAVNALERSFMMMVLWGIIWIVLIVPIAFLLAISIIGIVLIPLEFLLVVLAFIIGYIASAISIGRNIFLAFKKIPPPFVDAVLGIMILFFIGFVPVVGVVLKAIFLIAGFGAVMTTRFGTIK